MRTVLLLGLAFVVACEGAPTSGGPGEAETLGFDQHAEVQQFIQAAQHRVILTQREEVPPSGSLAYGVFFVHIEGTVVETIGRIWNPGCETILAGHIHHAPPGSNGPVVLGLYSGPITPPAETFRSRGIVTEDVAKRMVEAPEEFYINFHSTRTPSGFIRGHLGRNYPDARPPAVPRSCPQ